MNKNPSPAETSVLIVDDSAQYSAILSKILTTGFGFREVTVVDDPAKAEALLARDPDKFQMLFVDYNFPSGTTGGELLTRLNQQHLTDGKTTFLITSEPTVENMKQATAAGAVGVVAKPFDRAELKRQLEKAELKRKAEAMESF